MHVVIAGGTGLIGTALTSALTSLGHEVRLLSRTAGPGRTQWDPSAGRIDAASLDGVDAVVNLAGAGIGDRRWTDAYKRELRDSRLAATELLATTIAALDRRPAVLLSGSAVGWYGDRGDEACDESSSPGTGFLAELCRDWEAASAPAAEAGIRVATLRTGLVLSRHGGALRKQLPLFKLGLGGRIGDGRQWLSWISIDDHVAATIALLAGTGDGMSGIAGPVNLTAPNPVTNREFTSALAAALHRPAFARVPRFAPALVLGRELADNLLFTGQRVMPSVLASNGFGFAHPTIDVALAAVLAG